MASGASATHSTTTAKILTAVKTSKDYTRSAKYGTAVLGLVKTVLDHGGTVGTTPWKTNINPFKRPNRGARQNKQIVLKSNSETILPPTY